VFILLISIITFATPSKFLRSTSIKPVNFLKFPITSPANNTGIEKLTELLEVLITHFSRAKL